MKYLIHKLLSKHFEILKIGNGEFLKMTCKRDEIFNSLEVVQSIHADQELESGKLLRKGRRKKNRWENREATRTCNFWW